MSQSELPLEERVAALLQEKHLHITTAESCTGGLIAGTLVNVAGISDTFSQGYITYANEAKEALLGVSHETLARYGAVSPQTAEEMATGAAKAANAQVSVISTGIAGPGGGTADKPVGLVYLACFYNGMVHVEKHQFSGDRQQVRRQAVDAALQLVWQCLTEEAKG